jgi:dinuclear metal center YbgI/SA1388 family protein
MVKLNSITSLLNKELKIKKIKDSSRNGLQVKTTKDIKLVGFAVDVCLSTFEKAKKAKVDLLIVHHGIKWIPQKYKEITKKRINFLEKNKIGLYGVHLPLDAHYKYGNNIGLCNILNLIKTKKFGKYHGAKIGYKGEFKKPTTINKITNVLNKKLKTKSIVLPFGKKHIKSLAIVSGGGIAALEEAIKEKQDCFLVGEIPWSAYHRSKDYKINMVVAGHYATETVGVKALMPFIREKFKIKTIFIDNPPRGMI